MCQKKIFILLLSLPFYLNVAAQTTSTFDSGDEGWTVSDIADGNAQAVVYHSTGGNPGGYVSPTIVQCCTFHWKAPAKFMGGQCLNSYGMNLKFDLQLSAPGVISSASAVYGNVRITSGPYTIVADVGTVPAVSPGWTSYSVPLDETTVWHNANISGAISSHAEIIGALSNVNKIEIVAQGAFFSDPDVALDNVILEKRTFPTPPSITNFSPQSGIPGTTSVTINGANFNSTASNNVVYFGGLKATITSATATKLVVGVPRSAPLSSISVYDKSTGLSATTNIPFQPRYDNNKDFGGQIIMASMADAVVLDLEGTSGTPSVGDIDGDGLNDIVIGEGNSQHKFGVYRNAGVTNDITTSSFFPKLSFNITNPYVKGFTALADFDGDGKLDVAVSTATTFYAYVTVFRNTSTPGLISFAPEQNYLGYSYSDGPITTADIDNDGKPEIVCVFNNNCGTSDRLYLFPNRSTPGNIDFCGISTFGPVYTCGGHVTVGDLDGDKLPDVVVDATSVTVFRNKSTPGTYAFDTPFVISAASTGKPVLADLDMDGKMDIAYGTSFFNVEVRKNIYSGGTFDATSFAAPVLLNSTVYTTGEIIASDINSDGRLDLVLSSSNDVGILENVTTTGSLTTSSFLQGIAFPTNLGTCYNVSPIAADFDGDNKPDVLVKTTNTSPTKILVYRNESFPAPRITSLSTMAGNISSAVTITGSNLSTGLGTPVVSGRLAGVKTTITPASNTSASTTVPVNSISDRFSFTEHGLTAFSKPFHATFGTSKVIDATSFPSSVDFTLTNSRDVLNIADLDDDGKPDVVVADADTRIFHNTHATAGQPITTSSLNLLATTFTSGYNSVLLDIDGDGKIDLNNGYGVNKNNSTVGNISFLYGTTGIYTYAGGYNYTAPADFNGDGKTDLAVTNGGVNLQIYENQSSRRDFVNSAFAPFNITPVNLTKPSNYGGMAAADFNNDGNIDLAATSPNADNFTFYTNLGVYGPLLSSSFSSGTNVATSDEPTSLTASDFDGDGKIDLAVSHNNATFVSVYRNTSTASISFAAPVNFTTLSKQYNIGSQDLDGDGLDEIVIIHRPNPGPGSFSILQNKSTSGNINFNSVVNYPLTSPGRNTKSLAFADINSDQKPDILIVGDPWPTGTTALMVFENKIASGPVITITKQPADVTVCEGVTGIFDTDATGTTNILYQWQYNPNTGTYSDVTNGNGYSGATSKTLTITSAKALEGRYRCKISGDNATTVITNDEGLFVNVIPTAPMTTGDSNCNPKAFTLTASGASNGQYLWFDAPTNGLIAGQTNNTYTTPVLSTTTTYYAAIKIGGCESTRTAVVAEVKPLGSPTIAFDPPVNNPNAIILCGGATETLSVSSSYENFLWSDASTSNSIDVTATGDYSVTVKDAKGCSATSTVSITANPNPIAIITQNDDVLTASTGDTYQWRFEGNDIDNATSQTLTINIFEYGSYAVSITLDDCTSLSDDFVNLITGKESPGQSIKYFPNPIDDQLTIENNSSTTLDTKIYDRVGHILINKTIPTGTTILHTDHISSGLYFLEIKSNNGVVVQKLKKQ